MTKQMNGSTRSGLLWMLAVAALSAATCVPPNGGITPPDAPDNGNGDNGGTSTLQVLLFANRSLLIRGDANESTAVVTAESSVCATFNWRVCVASDDPTCTSAGENAAGDLLDFDTPSSSSVMNRSELSIDRILSDPGAAGTELIIEVDVTTAAGVDGCAEGDDIGETVTEAITIRIIRPDEPLTVSLTAPQGIQVNPGGQTTLVARITGGRPFTGQPPQTCTGTGLQSPPNSGDPYNVVWSVNDAALTSVPVMLDFAAACLTDDDGVTVAEGTYGAPIATGIVLISIEVTDEGGSRVTESLSVNVGSNATLSITQASADNLQVAPGESTNLQVAAQGGTQPYTITYSIDPNTRGGMVSISDQGSSDPAVASCTGIVAGEICTGTYTAAADETGGDTVFVTVTDSVNATASTTIPLIVASPQTLSLSANTGSPVINSDDGSTTVTATVSGGTLPYTICYAIESTADGLVVDLNNVSGCGTIGALTNCTCVNTFNTGTTFATAMRTLSAVSGSGGATIRIQARDAVGAESTVFVSVDVSPFTSN